MFADLRSKCAEIRINIAKSFERESGCYREFGGIGSCSGKVQLRPQAGSLRIAIR